MKIILASSSKTRKKILLRSGLKFIQKNPTINEENEKKKLINSKISSKKVCQNLAKEKSVDISKKIPDSYIIGADSCVIFKNKIFSKPKSKVDAIKKLKALNGKKHILYSAVCISLGGKIIWRFNDQATLVMRKLNNQEIIKYVNSLRSENIKSSGLYQLEDIGINLFKKIKGDIFTILGIPLLPLLHFFRNIPNEKN